MSPVDSLKKSIAKQELELQKLKMALEIIQKLEWAEVNKDDPADASYESMPAEPSAPPPAPLPAASPVKTEAQAPSFGTHAGTAEPARIKPVYTGPYCGACNAKMYQTARIMPSGAQVTLWKCNDSGCGNEVYQ